MPAKNVYQPVCTFFNTYPRCPLTKERVLEHYQTLGDLSEYVVCQEHHKDGSLHLHVYARFIRGIPPGKDMERWIQAFDIDGYHGNYQAARSAKHVQIYCTKAENFLTNLDLDHLLTPQAKRAKFALELESKSVADLVRNGEIHYTQARAAVYAKQLLTAEPYDHDTVRGVWIKGIPEAGKTHMARTKYPGAFIKEQTKWFDGYYGQEAIILEDFDSKEFGHELKIWADKWACYGETKGGHVYLKHKHFVVTSNYFIEDLYGHDAVLCEAIKRRFPEVIVLTEKYKPSI